MPARAPASTPSPTHAALVELALRAGADLEGAAATDILRWTVQQFGDVARYIRDNDVLVNPLIHDGYGSVGCAPCTRRLRDGETARDGRWAAR